jgi:Tol biopolymer transport system component
VQAFKRAPIRGGLDGQASEPKLSIFVLNLETREVTLAIERADSRLGYCGSPSWSADGRRMIFDATPGKDFGASTVYTVEATDDGPKLTDLGPGNCPTFSPDGKQIVFLSNLPPQFGTWLMKANGGNSRPMGGTSYGITKWAPVGNRIMISTFDAIPIVMIAELHADDSATMTQVQLAGQDLRSTPGWDGVDAQTIITVLRSNTVHQIVLLDVSDPANATIKQTLWRQGDGATVKPAHPQFSAATGACVFVGWNGKDPALYLIEKGQSTSPQRIEPKGYGKSLFSSSFSPDGRYLFFCSEPVRSSVDP